MCHLSNSTMKMLNKDNFLSLIVCTLLIGELLLHSAPFSVGLLTISPALMSKTAKDSEAFQGLPTNYRFWEFTCRFQVLHVGNFLLHERNSLSP